MPLTIFKTVSLLLTFHLTTSFAPSSNFYTFTQRSSHHASVPQVQLQRSTSPVSKSTQLKVFFNDNQDDEDYEDDSDDYDSSQTTPESLENARKQFELMMATPTSDNQEHGNAGANPNKENNIHNLNNMGMDMMDEEERYNLSTRTIRKAVLSNRESPPPLTAVLKERRIKEIQLLKSLHNSDASVSDLWSHWISERGQEAASQIMHAEELISVESWNEAEVALLSLIDEYGIQWAEPVNRLATLYYMLGRYDEAKALCELVLDIKPWHFGAISGIVLVCTAKNDAVGARYWAERRLPPAAVGERRISWTENAVREAEQKLHDASLIGRNKKIGQEEIQFRQMRAQLEKHVSDIDMFENGQKSDGINDADEGENSFDAWQ